MITNLMKQEFQRLTTDEKLGMAFPLFALLFITPLGIGTIITLITFGYLNIFKILPVTTLGAFGLYLAIVGTPLLWYLFTRPIPDDSEKPIEKILEEMDNER